MLKEDFHTNTWRRLKKLYNERLNDLREQNDQMSLTPERTAAIRGAIAEVKKFLDLESSSSDTNVFPGTPGDDSETEGR